MGYWKLEAWKQNSKGQNIPLNDSDLDYIAKEIKKSYIEGEIIDGDDNGN